LTKLDERHFRQMLATKGLKLDDKTFAAALLGAQNLRAEVLRVANYLEQKPDKHA